MPGFMYPCVALFYGYYWPRSCDGLLKKDKKRGLEKSEPLSYLKYTEKIGSI